MPFETRTLQGCLSLILSDWKHVTGNDAAALPGRPERGFAKAQAAISYEQYQYLAWAVRQALVVSADDEAKFPKHGLVTGAAVVVRERTDLAALVGETVQLTILGPDGKPARVESIEGTIGRATQRTDDQALVFRQNEMGVHVAEVTPLDFGKWDVRFIATAANGTPFRQRLQIILPEN